MSEPRRTVAWSPRRGDQVEALLSREWLVTNGLGGYSSGTLAGVPTRRYHGALVAALPAPHGRTVMLNHVIEELCWGDGRVVALTGQQRVGDPSPLYEAHYEVEFRLDHGLPVWSFDIDGHVVEKRVLMPHLQNSTYVSYRLVSVGDGRGGDRTGIRLRLHPAVHFRSHEAPVSTPMTEPYTFVASGDQYEVRGEHDLPALRLLLHAEHGAFTLQGRTITEVLYRVEGERGYERAGHLWSPGYFHGELREGSEITLLASTESWETIRALEPLDAQHAEHLRRSRLIALASPAVREGPGAELVLAADQFIISPAGRAEESVRAHAVGDEVRTVIAGYHWFTDWGRDTMISLEGLALVTGRSREGGYILRTFGHYVRDGLIPNMFPDRSTKGLYHTADATLWFFHAIHRYLEATADRGTLERLLPTLVDIVEHHLRGTRFGIGVDPTDGLLRQGAEGYQLTWMDAKVGDWVVTPRRGKAVEINALWYNALRLLQGWLSEERGDAAGRSIGAHAERTEASFNARFWNPEAGHLYDVVDGDDGDDAACRPNQIFAISLPHPVLARERWTDVVESVRARLLTPVGLRSLAPGHSSYAPKYYGDLRARDAAYHQGTVWGWLIGPFIDAWLKLHPGDRTGARHLLDGLIAHLNDFGVGSIAEIFDAEPPFTPRGCIAQAWSVAETLRCLVLTAPDGD